MQKNNKKFDLNSPTCLIYIVIGVICLCLISMAVTYAFFSNSVSAKDNELGANSGKIDISYQKGNDISGPLYGTSNYLNGLNTTVRLKANTNSLKAYVGIYLKINSIANELKSPYLMWAVYKNDETSPVKNGNFATANAGDSIQIVDDFLAPSDYDNYTLYIWLDGEGSTNDMQDKRFSASIYASTSYIGGQLE